MPSSIEIHIPGPVVSKKNAYTPNRDGRGMHKNPELKAAIDSLAIFIPGDIRDLKLKHPRMEFYFTVPANGAGADRDGKVTTLLDVMVTMGVLADDNIRNCNGVTVTHPAVIGKEHATRIVLTPAEDPGEPGNPRYVNPRRRARSAPLASLAGSIPGLDAPPLAEPGSLDSFVEWTDEEETPWDD